MDNTSVDLGLVQNVQGLDKLRQMSRGDINDKKNALVAAAQQFESILNQFWLKEMRATNETICPDSPLNSRESSFFQSMLDEQMITSMAKSTEGSSSSITHLLVKQFAGAMGDEGKEIIVALENRPYEPQSENGLTMPGDTKAGLMALPEREGLKAQADFSSAANVGHDSSYFNDLMARKLSNSSNDAQEADTNVSQLNATVRKVSAYENVQTSGTDGSSPAVSFVQKFMPVARKVAQKFGLNPLVIVAQAALETGWGQHVGKGNNFFGIKAGGSWQGEAALETTSEFVKGRMVTENAYFRSYKDAEASFEDYARLVTSNDRYAKAVVQNRDPDRYFEEIQRAGYATDPNYALKLKSIVRNDAFSSYRYADGKL